MSKSNHAADGPVPRASQGPGALLWAVASGKGGTGKSVLCASLAAGMAQRGARTVAVDLDLGGANLHALFGADPAAPGIADLLRGDVTRLEDALVSTSVPGVQLLAGARGALDVAHPTHARKRKLLGGLRRLDAHHVLIDLGPGSGFHTLDAFLAADRRILVVTPEPTAVENARHFLKAAFFRSLRELTREPEAGEALADVLDAACRAGATPRELVEAAGRVDPGWGSRLRSRMRAFEVLLVVNRAELARAADSGLALSRAFRSELGLNLRPLASIASDDSVRAAVARGVPVSQLFPGSPFTADVRALVGRLLEGQPVPEVAEAPEPRVVAAPEPPAVALPELGNGSPGPYLRMCRERLGVELAALHERTRIRHSHLEHIEAERFAALPPDFYTAHYVRQVAEALGVPDPAGVADRFLECARARRTGLPLPASSGPLPVVPSPDPQASPTPGVPSAAELIALVDLEPEPLCAAPDEVEEPAQPAVAVRRHSAR